MSSAVFADVSTNDNNALAAAAERELVDLLGRVGRGDRAALKSIYESYGPRLFAMLSRLVVRREFAEDLLRDVFVAVWQEAWQFDPNRSSATAWLISLSRRKCAMALKRDRAHARLGGGVV